MEEVTLIKKLKDAETRNADFLHLTANESQMSKTAADFLRYKISERYYFGGGEDGIVDSNPFLLLGIPELQELIEEARRVTLKMVRGEEVNLRCLSGVHAMMCGIVSMTDPGDVVMTVRHQDGGHFATKGIVEKTGRRHVFAPYDLEKASIDVAEMAKIFREMSVKMLYLDISYYIDTVNLTEIREAIGPDPIIIFDASHTMGLIMGQEFQSPLTEGANVICANTHKTLPGPQKGMMVFRDKSLAEKASVVVDGSMISSSHTHHMAALAVTLLEMNRFGCDYAKQVIVNSNILGRELENLGYKVRKTRDGVFSKNHQVHVFVHNKGDRVDLYKNLVKNGISTNFDDPLGGITFARLGTQEITRRGMKEKEMIIIAQMFDRALRGEDVRVEVETLNKSFSCIKYSFDNEI